MPDEGHGKRHAPVRIVFADMDDTFLSTDKSVPEGNLALLNSLAERDVPFVPCTGRVWRSVPPEVLTHPATRFVVGANGASVMDVSAVAADALDADGRLTDEGVARARTLHVSPLGKERTLALYDRVRDLPVTFDIFWNGAIYIERARYELIPTFEGMTEPDRRTVLDNRTPVDLTVPQIVERVGDVERITSYVGSAEDRGRVIAAVEEDPTIHYTSSTRNNVEIMDRNTSKGSGLRWLCQHLGIPVERSVGFGDSPNDLAMLDAAGDGVAVANALPEVRAVADHVARWTNDESAVARYLEGLI